MIGKDNKFSKCQVLEESCKQFMPTYFNNDNDSRREVLEEKLVFLEKKYKCGLDLYRLLVTITNDFFECYQTREKYGFEFQGKYKGALAGIQAIRDFLKPIGNRNHGPFILSIEDHRALKLIENKIRKFGQLFIDLDNKKSSQLKQKGKKGRLKTRNFTLPYEKLAYLFLGFKTNLPPGKRQEMVVGLFYGIGLEKKFETNELGKLINKAHLPTRLKRFRFLDPNFFQKIESKRC